MSHDHNGGQYSHDHRVGTCDPCSDPVLPAPFPTVHYPPTNPCPPQRMPHDQRHREPCHTSQQYTNLPRAGHIPWNVLFDERSTQTASAIVIAHGHGLLFQAYGLQAGDSIRLQMVSGSYHDEVVQDVIVGRLRAQLTVDSNVMFVPFPGRFKLQYTGSNLTKFHAYSVPVPYEHYPAMAAFTQVVANSVDVFDTVPHPATEPMSQIGTALPLRMTGADRDLILADPSGWFTIGGKRVPYWD